MDIGRFARDGYVGTSHLDAPNVEGAHCAGQLGTLRQEHIELHGHRGVSDLAESSRRPSNVLVGLEPTGPYNPA